MSRVPNPSLPNAQEVTGTTLPLLTSLLAGFSVTILVQFFEESNATEGLSGLALGLLATSIPIFLAATAFAAWAQSFDYRNLTEDVRGLLRIQRKEHDLEDYLDKLHRRWWFWYQAMSIAFYVGLGTFLAGIGILVWQYIAGWLAFVFGFFAVLCSVAFLILRHWTLHRI